MTLVRWDPFRSALSFQDRMSRLFPEFRQQAWGEEEPAGLWAPAVDIFERGDNLVVRAELPGVRREDIDVNVQNGVLTLKGERRREAELSGNGVYRVEAQYGSFVRAFTLPTQVNAAAIQASYRDGVLEIVLPKSEEAKPKKVEIQAA